jgi:hypothetical protein
MMSTKVELETLVGEHELSGVDFEEVKASDRYNEDANVIRFVLDGKIHVATEDPSDGYRSSLRDVEIVDGPPVTNMFGPVKVVGSALPNGDYVNDCIQFRDAANGEVILEVGTMNTDDYYPWFVGKFHPERMAINASKSTEEIARG